VHEVDVEVPEEDVEDHPCEAVGVEHEVDEVDSEVTVEVEVVDVEVSSREAHQGVVVDEVVAEADSEVDEEDTRFGIHVQYACWMEVLMAFC
jgi:hypothetical protein